MVGKIGVEGILAFAWRWKLACGMGIPRRLLVALNIF